MGEVVLDFDDKPDEMTNFTQLLTLRARTECIVRLPTESKGSGIISKGELVPGVYLAEALTEGIDGYCVTSIINTLEEDITIETPFVKLEEVECEFDDVALIFSTSVSENCNRLSK
jgi:hypothetical protein